MSWINLLSQLFFAVLVTSIAGNIMFMFWFLCRKFFPDLNPKLVYHMLKWVVVMFLMPIAYFGIAGNYKAGYVQNFDNIPKRLFIINLDRQWFQWLTVLWFAATICVFVFFLKNEICKFCICRSNFDDGNSLVQIEFERIKAELGIKGKVSLLRNDDPRQKSPFVIGIWDRKVILPYLDYSEEELKVILYHELNHVKKRDIIFRYLTILAIVLNSINPFSYLLWERIQLWAEADCDARTIDCLKKEGVSKRQYYDTIWEINELHSEKSAFFNSPMLMGAAETFYRRIHIMKRYSTDKRKLIKTEASAWMVLFAVISTVTAQAAGVGLAEMGDEVLQETQVVIKEDKYACLENWSDEMLLKADDAVGIIYADSSSSSSDDIGTVEWDVPAGTRYVTNAVYMTEGTRVQMAYAVEQQDCLYRIGLMYASGESIVIEGTGLVTYSFEIPVDGYYHILVENCGAVTLRIMGAHQY